MGMLGDIGGIVGGLFGAGDAEAGRKNQLDAYKRGLETLQNTREEAGPSAIENIAVNPALQAAQMQALGALQGEAQAGGMTAQDRATQQQSMDATSQQERGQREAILQQAAARNQGGTGASLAAQLANQQGAAQRNAMQGTQQVADSRARAMQAMAGAGGLAGQIRGQQFGEQSNIASAKDLINKFNAGQRLGKSQAILGGQQSLGNTYNAQGEAKKKEATGMGEALGGLGGGIMGMFGIPGM